MENEFGNLEGFIDAVADRVLGRLTGRPSRGPTGEPLPQLGNLPGGQQEIPSLVVRPRLRMQGLELTQSTQFYGTGYGDVNSVPIVALKPLVVRAYPYVTPGLFEGDTLSGKTVTGELVLFRWGKEVFRTGPTRAAGARVGPQTRLDRTLWDREATYHVTSGKLATELVTVAWNPTLNFSVPAWYVRAGQTTAVVRVWLTSGEGGIQTASESFQVISVNAPKLALMRVTWRNTATNPVTSPTDAELLGLSANTIAVHRANLMKTLAVRKTAALVLYAVRHGLVTADGLMNPNRFLAVAIGYLFATRPGAEMRLVTTYATASIDPERRKEFDKERRNRIKKGKPGGPEWDDAVNGLVPLLGALPDADGGHTPEGIAVVEEMAARAGAVVLGPGLGRSEGAAEFVHPDAAGLNFDGLALAVLELEPVPGRRRRDPLAAVPW